MVDASLEATRKYYDDFASWYENKRRPNDPHGYHALIDDLEIAALEPFGRGKEVLECGCGTGLLLERIARFASRAEGVDLSPGMLEHARARGLSVREASVTELPFEDASFDVACSFKVLAHVEEIQRALAEMARVVRPGGYVLAELYNGWSLRALAKRLGPAGRISRTRDESAVFTRFDSPTAWKGMLPPSLELEGVRGVRIVTAATPLLRVPVLGGALRALEERLMPTPAAYFAGFAILVAKKR
jgi:ubiquinone/menaquinone biosynthesis C-methylase UbiE